MCGGKEAILSQVKYDQVTNSVLTGANADQTMKQLIMRRQNCPGA